MSTDLDDKLYEQADSLCDRVHHAYGLSCFPCVDDQDGHTVAEVLMRSVPEPTCDDDWEAITDLQVEITVAHRPSDTPSEVYRELGDRLALVLREVRAVERGCREGVWTKRDLSESER